MQIHGIPLILKIEYALRMVTANSPSPTYIKTNSKTLQ